ncbi:hypothetical protein C5167_034718 [Papaver somniferum]|uniref:Uncharacterized protein n=1 Tax=Papaver somniferum TaxID=3469 RepID=A0A4Y7KI16_PAPSO|nr:hypothetical protein C5167_034718 [Papaver somniferum]
MLLCYKKQQRVDQEFNVIMR